MINISKLPIRNLILLSGLLLLSCRSQGVYDPLDRQTGISRDEMRKLLIEDKAKKNNKFEHEKIATPLPRTSRMLAIPSAPAIGGEKLISFSVTDQVSLKDVLIELGRIAKIDIDIDPTISGGVIINAKNRPLKEVMDRICNMGNLRYSFKNNVLHFERDLPYAKHYIVDYINGDDLWSEVETNLSKIVNNGDDGKGSSISSNKVAGIVTVYSNDKKQFDAEKYLENVRKNSSAQVLIEAKVIEVTLKDNYKTGIDWTFGRAGFNGSGATNLAGSGTSGSSPDGFVGFVIPPGSRSFLGNSISATISLLEEFGNVRAIASPRINALNNQKAKLNFTDQLVYFTVQIQTNTGASTPTSTTASTQTTITSTKHEEPIGVELTIIPSINLKTNEVTLNVHPKLSSKGALVTDPAKVIDNTPGAQNPNITNQIPQINTREITTTMKVESGGTLVIGGLMKDQSDNTDTGVPFLSHLPIFGVLFKSVVKNTQIVETVIFIKATIVNSGGGVDKYDRELHDKFDTNKRSLFN